MGRKSAKMAQPEDLDDLQAGPPDDGYDADAVAASTWEEEGRDETSIPHLDDRPLFVALLKAAVEKAAPGDVVLLDYVSSVAGPLSAELALQPAKGGDEFIAARLAEGKTAGEVARYRHEQSLRAHLVNGLFPVARIARQLQAWQAPRLKRFDERAYRLLCAGYTLHDWLKLPLVDQWLADSGLTHSTVNPAKHLALVESIFREWCSRLGLDRFLEPAGGVEAWLHDLIYLASNTQVRWGTLLNMSALPHLSPDGRTRQLVTDLCTLADRIAYIARTPTEVPLTRGISELVTDLSDGQAYLLYHHVAENRGVLTNFIHNAAMSAVTSGECVPLLFAPSGVVYLQHGAVRGFQDIDPGGVAEDVVRRIRRACGLQLANNLTGFSRDGKGLKYAPYYDLHFSPAERIRITGRAAFKRIPSSKAPSAGTRFAKMAEKGMAPAGVDVDLPADIRVDQLAEFCALAARIAEDAAPDLDVTGLVLEELGLAAERPTVEAIAAYPQAGGVSYDWYYVAGVYLKHGLGKGSAPEEWQSLVDHLAARLADRLEEHHLAPTAARQNDGWDDLRAYVGRVLSFGPQTVPAPAVDIRAAAAAELARYRSAKTQGRGATTVCSLCSSSYEVNPQREAGILFAPQVYSNKQSLHGNKAIRNICRICEIEMMLRQILMNRQAVSGGRFEGQRVRYLYFYPTYFFTPETLAQLEIAYHQIQRLSFTSVRKALIDASEGQARLHLSALDYQRMGPLLMSVRPPDPADDRLFRMQFPADEPVTFYFLGVPPPGRDAGDAEAWINPAFLALVLPLALDVKVVATESPLPLLVEADELDETVFLDAPHDFVKDLLGREHISLASLLPRLQGLTAAYMIHMDCNANFAKGDYRWHTIPPLARNLAVDSLWAFAYLKKWQRAKRLDSIPADQAHLYLQLTSILDELKERDSMSHARELTNLYMKFYRAKRYNSNSILRPISIAAQAVLEADPRLFDQTGLVEAVRGELSDFMGRVASGRADGRLAPGSDHVSRDEAMRQFAEYFVGEIYCSALHADKSALRGKQLNLLKNACEVIYRDAAEGEWRARKSTDEHSEELSTQPEEE